jgi:hypothetical protein
VTFGTRRKIIAAKSSLAGVASRTTFCSGRRVMIERQRRRHLPTLRHTRSHVMTFIATQFLRPTMLGMTESNLESCGLRRRSRIAAELMTRAAGGNIPVAGFRLRPMALVARGMGVEARRNCHRHTTAPWFMTSRTTTAAHARVAGVIESHVKASERRKCFQCA